ncbi:DUF7520 family protein [Natrononativus amylolyticus]|uniref:DUF7520 family protein n=1 Tax=Natrononativus amylolyticus TaxID=2963434 RepID=UPI0020CEAF1F|nr:hypothetical protein [Natrononativus amylolyticus]
MTERRDSTGKRVVVGLLLGIVALTAALGAVLGAVVPAQTGLEEVTILAITFTVSPTSFALYGAVTVGTFLGVTILVVRAISQFEDGV